MNKQTFTQKILPLLIIILCTAIADTAIWTYGWSYYTTAKLAQTLQAAAWETRLAAAIAVASTSIIAPGLYILKKRTPQLSSEENAKLLDSDKENSQLTYEKQVLKEITALAKNNQKTTQPPTQTKVTRVTMKPDDPQPEPPGAKPLNHAVGIEFLDETHRRQISDAITAKLIDDINTEKIKIKPASDPLSKLGVDGIKIVLEANPNPPQTQPAPETSAAESQEAS